MPWFSVRLLGLSLVALSSASCAPNGTFLGLQRPFQQAPGPIEYQRNRANLNDPYPDPVAGPDMGIRPREFDKPLAEPVRSRYLTDSWWRR